MAVTVKPVVQVEEVRDAYRTAKSFHAIQDGAAETESEWIEWSLFKDGSIQLVGTGTIQVWASNDPKVALKRDCKLVDENYPVSATKIGADISTAGLSQISFCARFVKIACTSGAAGAVNVYLHGKN